MRAQMRRGWHPIFLRIIASWIIHLLRIKHDMRVIKILFINIKPATNKLGSQTSTLYKDVVMTKLSNNSNFDGTS